MSSGWGWLESTAELQTNTYGYDLKELDRDVEKLAAYIKWNLLAIYQETGEMGVEFSWAPWAVDRPFVNRDRVLAEIVDVKHFLGNILVAMAVTDAEFEEAYRAKQEKNRRRQASGSYSKRKGSLGEGSERE